MDRLNRPSKHHLLFPRQEWELRPETRRIRQSRSMIPELTRGEHDYMHEQVPLVPLLGHTAISHLGRLWHSENDTMRDIDALVWAMDRATAPHRNHQLERDLAGLAIEALLMQKTILKEIGYA